ncbi:putative prophage membrane protein [Erwinia amylovora Ea644]|uniref:phage holin family protein n=1 Tax=Erwinia amylovora TaxID=552 RepID=UPI0002C9142B|nr:phage holin family protein [Erwinia amylovora]CCP02985.1 putative prophage membrane protein [Erwinia amylovora Ea644]CCP06985.1 putative prophage membrane protein [Erwinia amylovora MR1]
MVISDLMVIVNVMLCTAIVLRLMFFCKPGGKHHWWASWLAYLIILAYASVPFRFLFDSYRHTHWAVVIINLILCAAVHRAKGNVALVFAVLRPRR